MSALLELGERYWALGLPAAARSALVRAMAQATDEVAALRLADIALAQGDAVGARTFAAEAAKRAPGPVTKLVLGRAHLAAGELTAARRALLVALEAPTLARWDRPRVHLELARTSQAERDLAGSTAQSGAAFAELVAAANAAPALHDHHLVEEVCAAIVAAGRAADATEQLAAAPAGPGTRLVRAALLAARHGSGDSEVTDRAIDDELAAAEAERPSVAVALRRLERRVRKHTGDHGALVGELAALVASAAAEELPTTDRARLWFLYASVCAEEPGADTRALAEGAYRKGLGFQPGHTGAACRLALLMFDRGDQAGALAEIERALRIDASHGLAWRNAARMLDAQSPSLGVVVGRLLDAANPGAGAAAAGVAPRLVTATAEVARHDVLAGVYAHGHRVKNLLGIIGSRTRSARKLAPAETPLHERLKDLEADVTALYEEWAQYLRSMQAPTPTIELVPLANLLHEVVMAAQARIQHVPIALETTAGLPDIRGDRMLLREALLNVISNAAEACASLTRACEVTVRARAIPAPSGGAAPIVELVITDSGPGIPRAHLGRLFVPGFTTKETGSGVGLAIAERVVAAHHGRITVESEEGQGTTITITMPTDKAGLSALPLQTFGERFA